MNHNKITVKGVKMFMGHRMWQVWYRDRLQGNFLFWRNAVRLAFWLSEEHKKLQ